MEKIGPTSMTQTLGPVWNEAAKRLADAEAIVIAGYSFPDNDKQMLLLLRAALTNNTKLRGITVVTEPKFGTERAAFEDRNLRVFGGDRLRRKLHFQHTAFEDWVAAGGGGFAI